MDQIQSLKLTAAKARLLAVDAIHEAKSGHPGGSLSCMDALTALYFHEMKIDPANPAWEDRDRFVLSKGHCAPALYAVLALRGYYPEGDLKLLRSIKGHFSGHPDMVHIKGVDMSTGSLGQGLSCAVGMALAARTLKKDFRTYAMCGDGEIEEGQIWEAAMAAAKWKLGNLCVFLDNNGLQIDGPNDVVMPSAPLDKKFEAFNWNVITIDGHDIAQILDALAEARKCSEKPTLILMKTVKGKGVSFMEDQVGWHGKAPDDEQFAAAKAELEAAIAALEEKGE
ncbi:MAG: transketolase [Oscillospiraceae bacterium]|nr:transketolase [Oscillospiraceae bacterium]